MRPHETEINKGPSDPHTVALQALVWTLSDTVRAERLLATTGLDPETLRHGIGDPALLSAVMDHLANHEPDLIACADALACSPSALVAAHRSLTA